MPQVFHVVQCYSCQTFQVHQVKKVTKWTCKLCGEKQSLKKVFGQGTGAECREHVQKLNTRRGELWEVAQLKPCHEVLYDVTSRHQQSSFRNDNTEFYRQDLKVQNNKWDMFVDGEVDSVVIDEEEAEEEKMFTTDASVYKQERKRKRVKSEKDSLGKRSARWSCFTGGTSSMSSAQDEYNGCDIPCEEHVVYNDNGELKYELNAYDSNLGSHVIKNETGCPPSEMNNSKFDRHNSYRKFHYKDSADADCNGLKSKPAVSSKWGMFDSFETDLQTKSSLLKSKLSMNCNSSQGSKSLKNSVVEDSTLRKECVSALSSNSTAQRNLGNALEQECPNIVGEGEPASFSEENNTDVDATPRNNVTINKSNKWDLFKEEAENFNDCWENNGSQESEDFDTRPYVSFDPSDLKRIEMNMPEKGTSNIVPFNGECDNEEICENNARFLMGAVKEDDRKDKNTCKSTGTVSMLNDGKNKTILCGSKWGSFVNCDKDINVLPLLEENETSQNETIYGRDTGLSGKENRTLNAVIHKKYGAGRVQDEYTVQSRNVSIPNKVLFDVKLKDTRKAEPMFSAGEIDDDDFEL